MKLTNQLEHFEGFIWKREINVRDFIQHNYTPYTGDSGFLAGPSERTHKRWSRTKEEWERRQKQ